MGQRSGPSDAEGPELLHLVKRSLKCSIVGAENIEWRFLAQELEGNTVKMVKPTPITGSLIQSWFGALTVSPVPRNTSYRH